jgi:transketolase
MARPGVGVEKITEAIRELEARGKEPTVTAIRERLGSGSYSTIGAVLADWRRERASEARPAVPESPDIVRNMVNQLWAEAWNGVMRVHEPERQAFQRERQEHERTKGEMLAEIARLEGELEAERERGAKAVESITTERDQFREEAQTVRASLAAAEGALNESRNRVEREEEKNRELSERVIAEAARRQSLATRVEELEKVKRR